MASGRRIRCGHNNRKNTVDQEVDRTKQGKGEHHSVVHEGCSWLKGTLRPNPSPTGAPVRPRPIPPQKFGIGTASSSDGYFFQAAGSYFRSEAPASPASASRPTIRRWSQCRRAHQRGSGSLPCGRRAFRRASAASARCARLQRQDRACGNASDGWLDENDL
jgi:hypothetical protein